MKRSAALRMATTTRATRAALATRASRATVAATTALAALAPLIAGALEAQEPVGRDAAVARTADEAEAALVAGTDPLIINIDGRTTTSLDGPWRIIVDPFQTGYYSYRWQPDPNGYFQDREPRSPADRVEYSFDEGPLLRVPGDWNSQRDDLLFYEGTVWYRQTFDYADLPADRRLFVYFGAANYEARVWLNGEELGVHAGGFTPFDLEITDHLEPGENSLVVKVDNTRRMGAVPTVNADWWNYGGLTRRVALVETPRTFVREYLVQLDPENPDRVAGWVRLDGPEPSTPVTVRIPETGLATTVTPDPEGYAEFLLDATGLERWSPESPRLYDVALETAAETVTDRIGFRTLETRGTEILLNGEPIFLRGICMHEEAPLEPRRAFAPEDARTLLGWVKELNGNFARLAHYPHNEAMVRAADEMGVLLWGEVPVYWTIAWENPETLASARRQLSEVITRDRNRAAVALWSVANETPRDRDPEHTPRLDFLRALVERVRELDPTRLVTAALEHHYADRYTIEIEDPLGEYLDVLGNNEYIGWYDGPPEKADSVTWRSPYEKPLIMSEFGGGARQGFRGPATTIWTEDYQARQYRHQVDMLDRIDFLAGTAPWILKDFRSPKRPLPDIQDYFNRKGLVSERGERKEAFGIMQAFYREIAEQGGTAATRTGLRSGDEGASGDEGTAGDEGAEGSAAPAGPAAEPGVAGSPPAGYQLVWADEFDEPGRPDTANWTYERGFVRNREAQWYQPENARVENGLLVIEARRERRPNPRHDPDADLGDWRRARPHADYTSASLTTRGLHAWRYGRVEMRARIPTGQGMWPAFWTVGDEGRWPASGEIDILEYYQGDILANAAWAADSGWTAAWDDVRVPVSELGDAGWPERFHVWRMDWDPSTIRLYVDDRLLNTIELDETLNRDGVGANPLRKPHHLILNLAIGGTNGGDPSEVAFPRRYEVDWVRVYQAPSHSTMETTP